MRFLLRLVSDEEVSVGLLSENLAYDQTLLVF